MSRKRVEIAKNGALMRTNIPGFGPVHRGKVREGYIVDDRLVLIATDRMSAFDVVMPTGIPEKGRVLTGISLFWFNMLAGDMGNHIISGATLADLPKVFQRPEFEGRTMICQLGNVLPIECIIRGNLTGSGLRDYKRHGQICGIALPPGMEETDKFPSPIFTPSTKAGGGLHDENITFVHAMKVADEWVRKTYPDKSQQAAFMAANFMPELRDQLIGIFVKARDYAAKRGIVLADTKIEVIMLPSGRFIICDELFTPDSSRFWPSDKIVRGETPPSFDKEPFRKWLEKIGFNKQPPGPKIPANIVAETRARYIQAYELLTGKDFKWK